MTISEIIVTRSPSTVVDSRVLDLITLATELTGEVFGGKRNDAIALLVLHWLALSENRGSAASAGSIKMEKDITIIELLLR